MKLLIHPKILFMILWKKHLHKVEINVLLLEFVKVKQETELNDNTTRNLKLKVRDKTIYECDLRVDKNEQWKKGRN